MRKFAERTKLTGQLCFDFIRDGGASGGACFPIECNPRVHSQCAAFPFDDNDGDGEQPQFGDAVLADHFPETLYPRAAEPPVFWLYNEVNRHTRSGMARLLFPGCENFQPGLACDILATSEGQFSRALNVI